MKRYPSTTSCCAITSTSFGPLKEYKTNIPPRMWYWITDVGASEAFAAGYRILMHCVVQSRHEVESGAMVAGDALEKDTKCSDFTTRYIVPVFGDKQDWKPYLSSECP